MAQLPLPVLDALPLGAHRLLALTDEQLFEQCGVRIAFTTRLGGVSKGAFASLNCSYDVGDDNKAVTENRRRVLEAIDAAGMPTVSPVQVHGTDVHVARTMSGNAQPEADCIVITTPGVVGWEISGDCLLAILVAPSGRFAIAHAGWRGAVAQVAAKAAKSLSSVDGSTPETFNAYLGPCICGECYEVGDETVQAFENAFGEGPVVSKRHVSLTRAVRIDLERAGLRSERIVESGFCTKCNDDLFFSYRASGGRCGRMSAVAFARK